MKPQSRQENEFAYNSMNNIVKKFVPKWDKNLKKLCEDFELIWIKTFLKKVCMKKLWTKINIIKILKLLNWFLKFIYLILTKNVSILRWKT